MSKTVSIIVITGLIIALGIIFIGSSKTKNVGQSEQSDQNIEVRDGIQYVNINARGGYSPSVSTAKAGIPTKLVVKTKGTFDCSASLVIRSVGFQDILPQNSTTEIDLGVKDAGEVVQGLCSMGMYSFQVKFI